MVGFDIISDLGWNEPFNCVENREEHSWVRDPGTSPSVWSTTRADPCILGFADPYHCDDGLRLTTEIGVPRTRAHLARTILHSQAYATGSTRQLQICAEQGRRPYSNGRCPRRFLGQGHDQERRRKCRRRGLEQRRDDCDCRDSRRYRF